MNVRSDLLQNNIVMPENNFFTFQGQRNDGEV